MLYTPLTIRAMRTAYRAHHGQLDKGGMPYIFHPYHLAEGMEDEISCCAALLHDVVEDTSVTLEELMAEFPSAVTDVVDLLTHREGVAYENYLRAIRANPTARRIKLADIAHNSDPARCPELSPREHQRLRQKYAAAAAILKEVP